MGRTNVGGRGAFRYPTLSNPAAAGDILSGKQIVDKNGNVITGSMGTLGGSTITPSYSQQTVSCSGKKMTGNIVVNAIDSLKYVMNNKTFYDGIDFTNYSIIDDDKGYASYFTKWYNSSNYYRANHCVSTKQLNLSGYKYLSIHQTNWSSAEWNGGFWVALSTSGATSQKSASLETVKAYHTCGGLANAAGASSWLTLEIPATWRVNSKYFLKIEGSDNGSKIIYFDKIVLHNKLMLGD